MILILSIKNDYSTLQVCEWLTKLGKQYLRINGDEPASTKFIRYNILENELILNHKDNEFNLFAVESVWYRRSGMGKNILNIDKKSLLNDTIIPDDPSYHVKYHDREFKILLETIYYFLEQKKTLNKHSNSSVNKLITLDRAVKNGLKVPASYIISQKKDLIDLLKKKGAVITKALAEGIYHFTPHNAYYSYTEKLTLDNISELPDHFYPSLIQTEINKKYELRVFYLNGKCFPMVIFSQKDTQTEVDFRKYNLEKPNRMVPYDLPEAIATKINNLMNDLDLNSGSLDLIVSSDDEYYFLEVNPVGQFAMTSNPCNYFLEKEIAQFL